MRLLLNWVEERAGWNQITLLEGSGGDLEYSSCVEERLVEEEKRGFVRPDREALCFR